MCNIKGELKEHTLLFYNKTVFLIVTSNWLMTEIPTFWEKINTGIHKLVHKCNWKNSIFCMQAFVHFVENGTLSVIDFCQGTILFAVTGFK